MKDVRFFNIDKNQSIFISEQGFFLEVVQRILGGAQKTNFGALTRAKSFLLQ